MNVPYWNARKTYIFIQTLLTTYMMFSDSIWCESKKLLSLSYPNPSSNSDPFFVTIWIISWKLCHAELTFFSPACFAKFFVYAQRGHPCKIKTRLHITMRIDKILSKAFWYPQILIYGHFYKMRSIFSSAWADTR